MGKKFDCSGWATRANMLCSDGRTIMKNAFKDCDGETVPVIWNHQHNDVNEVLGHALLENRPEGVYAYVTFNDTQNGQNAKLLVRHGDVNRFSIYANKLKQQGGNVIHGIIREVSLVLAGANPGAVIETVMMHGEDSYEEGDIRSGDYIEGFEPLFHSDDEDTKGEEELVDNTNLEHAESGKTVKDVFETLNDEQKKAVYAMIGMALEDAGQTNNDEEEDVKHAESEEGETVADVFNTLSEKQKAVVYAIIGQAMEEANAKHSDEDNEGGNDHMKHNLFDQEVQEDGTEVLSHSEMVAIMDEAKRSKASLKDTFLEHGITNIDMLFPEATNLDREPQFIKRPDDWVTEVMGAVHKTPFSRIKSLFANITEADARARGYIKGNMKVEEVFTLLKRTTTPTTIYKKQKFDRDDLIDITEFDVVPWIKKEMRMMFDEELARAILVGDGRNASSDDKINEQNIRPIWTDEDLYTVKTAIPVTNATTPEQRAKAFIKSAIKSRKEYKGSGNVAMFMTEDLLTDCLLLEDNNGRIIYDTEAKLATALRVKKLVPVAVMEGLKREVGSKTHFLGGIYVNLADYNVGADKGGAVNMFEDFDIDFNAQKYLMESRCSGALTKPYAAVALEFVQNTSELAG